MSSARLRLYIASGADTCPFSDQEMQQFRNAFDDFATSRGAMSVSWDMSGGELYCLGDLHCLSRLLSDRDVALFPDLAQGVPAGYDGDIPAFRRDLRMCSLLSCYRFVRVLGWCGGRPEVTLAARPVGA